MKKFFQFILLAFALLLIVGFLAGVGGIITAFNPPEEKLTKSSILALNLDGVIMDAKDILELLRKHRKDERVKGVLIRISSPGGVVGPSQELYAEIKRTREEFKKPVIAYCASVAASGAYYAAVGADKIFTAPGCMIGSIGALIEFVNLEKLYDWAKIQRYAVTTGKFKDAGAEYKPLAPEARALFQEMLDDVLSQFKQAIMDGRKMEKAKLDQYADGRVFTGSQAVKLGFADELGTWDDARAALGEMVGLGKDPEVFKPKKQRTFFEIFEESTETRLSGGLDKAVERLTQTKMSGQPMFILPGAVQF